MSKQKSRWPAIESQISKARARRGTKLEKLIRDNQDFHLLAPEEASDEYGHPLWLRVYWRKTHPDLQYSKVNPGASYPDVLYRLHDWMVTHQNLPPGAPGAPGEAGTKGAT